MKCPMFRQDIEDNYGNPDHTFADCIKEECAWWDNGSPGCSILTIAQELAIKRQKEEVEL